MASRNKADEKVQVTVRCRPMNQTERHNRVKKSVECNIKSREINIATGTTALGLSTSQQTKVYNFDKVFGPNSTQFDVYKNVVESQLQDVLAGYNCTVLAYGQTGTGKTYTMEGERTAGEDYAWDTDPRAGIIPRALSQLFDCLEKAGCEFSVRVSLLEIYNEEIYDLLSHSNDMVKMRIYEDNHRKGSVVVSGLTEVHVRHKNEVYDIIQQGAAKRRTAATNLNEFSSRSHSVFSVTVHTKDISQNNMEEEELVKIGKLNLVDLAGSENIGRSGAVDKRAREAGSINQSLLTLGRCITALVDRAPHVPYRESKLTRLLQDSLGGSTKTSIIATISPGSDNLEETLSTLDYAARAKNIHNRPKINQKLTKRALIKEYDDEIERLRREVVALREKNGVYIDPKRYDEMVSQIETLTAVVKQKEEDVEKFETLFTQTSDELAERTERLHILHDDLIQTRKEFTEQCHLKVAYMEHGYKAVNHATELLDTANVVTGDIKKVHDKVDRVIQVQETNLNTFGLFSGRMKEDLDHLRRGTVNVLDENTVNLQATADNIENVNNKQNHLLDKLLSQITDLRKMMRTTSEETSENLKLLNERISSGVEDRRATLEDLKNEIKSSIDKHQEKMKKLDSFAESLSTVIKDVKDFAHTQRTQITDHVASTFEHHEKVKGFVERKLTTHEAQRIEMEEMQNNMRSSMEAMFKNMNEKFNETKENIQTTAQIASDFNDQISSRADLLIAEVIQKEEKVVNSFEESIGTIKKFCSDGVDDMVEMQGVVEEHDDVVSSLCDSIKEDLSCDVEKCNERFQLASESASCIYTKARDTVNDITQHRAASTADLTQDIASVKKHLLETRRNLEDSVKSITLEINEHAEKLRRVVPTGETPAKKTYNYRKRIPEPPVEEVVLNTFRERILEDSQEEEEEEENTEEEDMESKSDSGMSSTSIDPNQSITIPDGGGIPFFKKKSHKSRLAKVHTAATSKLPTSRVPFRALQNTD